MTKAGARTTANVVLSAAAIGAAYVVWRTPRLRRLARLAMEVWLGASVPVYLLMQVERAWVESADSA